MNNFEMTVDFVALGHTEREQEDDLKAFAQKHNVNYRRLTIGEYPQVTFVGSKENLETLRKAYAGGDSEEEYEIKEES